ncbi:MAG TPA: polymer-forming cytoskeletal protein, partial [Candidatus Acidoferrum sp.]
MWSKQQAAEPPGFSPSPAPSTPVAPFNQPLSGKLSSVPARSGARLGASMLIKGEVDGNEDLQIDGMVEGPIRLKGHELT